MFTLQDETRMEAVERFNRDGGNEADYIRSAPLKMADGTIETLTHCQICRAHLENGFIKHLFYCPFEGAADRLREAAPSMFAALKMAVLGFSPSQYLQGSQAAELIQLHQTAQRAGLDTATYILNTIRAAIAEAKGEGGAPGGIGKA